MFKPIDAFTFASTLMIIAAVGTTARAGHDDSPAGSDHTLFEVTADDDGSCRGTLSSPLGVVTGIVQVAPGARKAWATFRSGHGIGVAEIADVRGAGPYQGRLVGQLPVSGAFKPDSLRAGIIVDPLGFAIDVGTSEAKVSTSDSPVGRSSRLESAPALLFQDGDALFVYAFDGLAFRLLERKAVPPGTSAVDFTDIVITSYWIGAESGSTSCIAGSGE